MCVCVCVCVSGHLFVVGGRRNHHHICSDARVSRYSFVYLGAKTTQRTLPAKTCETRTEDEGRGQLGVRLQSRETDIQISGCGAEQSSPRHGATSRLYNVGPEQSEGSMES